MHEEVIDPPTIHTATPMIDAILLSNVFVAMWQIIENRGVQNVSQEGRVGSSHVT